MEDTWRNFHVTIETESFAVASVKGDGPTHVRVVVDANTQWNAESLLRLSAMLRGAALTLGERG